MSTRMFLVSAALVLLVGCATSTSDPPGAVSSRPAEVTDAILAEAASVITPETSGPQTLSDSLERRRGFKDEA